MSSNDVLAAIGAVGVASISIHALWAIRLWALPLAVLGLVFLRWPHRSKGEGERSRRET